MGEVVRVVFFGEELAHTRCDFGDLRGAQVDIPIYVVFEDQHCFEVGGEEPAEGVEVA